jgi:hypothetical protein
MMKARIIILLIIGIVMLCSTSVFADNRIDIEVLNATVLVPPSDSLSRRLLFKFDLPSNLNDKRIDYAQIVFYAHVDTLSRHSLLFGGYALTTDWNKSTVSWSNPWATEGGDYNDSLYEIGLAKAKGDGKIRFNITHLVEKWVQESVPNYGILIIPLEEHRKITELVHPSSFPQGVFAKVTIFFSYTHP